MILKLVTVSSDVVTEIVKVLLCDKFLRGTLVSTHRCVGGVCFQQVGEGWGRSGVVSKPLPTASARRRNPAAQEAHTPVSARRGNEAHATSVTVNQTKRTVCWTHRAGLSVSLTHTQLVNCQWYTIIESDINISVRLCAKVCTPLTFLMHIVSQIFNELIPDLYFGMSYSSSCFLFAFPDWAEPGRS